MDKTHSTQQRRPNRPISLAGVLVLLAAFPVTGAEPKPGADGDRGSVWFTEHLVWNDFSYGFGLQAIDVDGDGWLDLTAADTAAFVQMEPFEGEPPVDPVPGQGNNLPAVSKGPGIRNTHIYWFQNNGKGGFTRRFIAKNDLSRRLERHVFADINKDGKADMVIVDNLLGDVVWYKNPGPAAVKRGELWKKHFVSKGNMLGAVDVTIADFDHDGWLDVGAAGWRMGNCFRWFKNPGNVGLEEWNGWTIDGGFPLASCVVAGDIDGDGRPDLLATSGTSRAVLWYGNPGDPTSQPWRRNVIELTPGPRQPVFGALVDLNRDSRLDVVLALGSSGNQPGIVIWYEHAGVAEARVQWKKHMIGELHAATNVSVADIDGDGALDVAASGFMPGEVAWFRNPGNPAARWSKHGVKVNWPNVNQVIIADLDNDGRADLAGIADYGSMELRWWRNQGKRP